MIKTAVKIDNRLYERQIKKTNKKIVYEKTIKIKIEENSYEVKSMKIDAIRKKFVKRNNNRSNEKEVSIEKHIVRICNKSRKRKIISKIVVIQTKFKNDHDDLN